MDVENNDRRPVVRKTVVYQPASYIGFCDVSEVSKNNLNKRKMKSPTWEILSTRSSRSGPSPVKKYAKLIEEPTNEKSNHDYIIEQKKKWRQKLRNDEDLKKNMNEKKKQSLQELQIKSKLLLKRNLKKKTQKPKNPTKNSPCLQSLKKDGTVDTGINKAYHRIIDTSKIVPEKHEFPRLDSLPKHNNIQSISPSNENQGVDDLCETTKIPIVNSVNEVPSSQEIPLSDSNKSALLPSNCNSPILKSAAIKIQSSYRGYRTRKNIEPLKFKNKERIQIQNDNLPADNQKDKVSKYVNNVHQIKEDISKSGDTLSIPNMSVNYPYNFITAVKKKLSKSINAPQMNTDAKDNMSAQFNMSPLDKLRKECLANPSFFTIYNQNLDSVYVMPTAQTFSDDTRNKPFFSESTLVKHLDATINNSSREFSVFKKPRTLAELSPDPRITKGVLQKSTIISELKSSLQEIQNLTVSITFNEQVDKVDQIVSSESHKKDIKRNKIFVTTSDHTNQECAQHKIDDHFSPRNTLNAPDINLVWPRKIDVDKGNFEESTILTPKHYHRQFKNELTLLDSFNESLRQVQVVEETLSTMRQNPNSSNSSQFTNFHSGNESINNTWHQLEENLKNISSIKVSSNANISQSINENDHHLTKLHLEHKMQGITTFNSLNKSRRSSNVYNQSQMHDVMKTFEGMNAGSEIHNDIFKSHVVMNTALDAIHTDSRACSQTEFLNHNNTITNILDQFSGNQSLTGNITDQNDVVSIHDISSNTSFNSKKLRDVSLCDDVNLSNHLNKFCVCLITQYIEDEKVRSEYLNTLLKVREKTLLDATRLELLCLQMQKKQNHELVPLLKKKQRGLLLKSQQERNEIKHIKKFQEEQSQERKATLKRQLKNLKRMFSCEGSALDFKKKSSSLKNSSLILQSKGGIQNSPVKGINISFSSEANASNSTYGQVQQSLEKKKVDLSKQKRKLSELLHMHYDVQLDAAEIKAMEHRLQNPQMHIKNADVNADLKETTYTNKGNTPYITSAIDSHSFNAPEGPIDSVNIMEACDSNTHIPNEEFDAAVETNQNEVEIGAPLPHSFINESQSRLNVTVDAKLFGHQHNPNDVSSDAVKADYNFVLSGYSLNKLWEKITGDSHKKYDDKEDYHMSKDSLDYFFEEAKQFALQDLLKTLQCNLPQNVDNFSLAKANKADENARELVTKISHISAQSINTSSQCNFNTEDCNNYSSSLLKSSNEQGNNNTNILNNLIQSNSYHPKIQSLTANHSDKLAVIEEAFEMNNLNEDIEMKSQDNVLSDTFTIKENLSLDSSDQSDSSKSTAHSLVEELTQLDISKINEQCENVENVQCSHDFTLEDRNENKEKPPMVRQTNLSTDSKPILPTSFSSDLTTCKEDIDSNVEFKSKLFDNQPKYNKTDESYFNQKYLENNKKQILSHLSTGVVVVNECDKIKPAENISQMGIPEESNANCIEFVGLTENKLFDEDTIPKIPIIIEVLTEKVQADDSITEIVHDKPSMDIENDEIQKDLKSYDNELMTLEEKDSALPPSAETDGKNGCVERGCQEKTHKAEGGTDVKSHSFTDMLLGHETITPSPDQSPRDSPTGEYSPAAVSLSICRIDEAEELRKKQLAIELEIKALEQQSQLPYCLVREIPDKPPPPYIPPSEDTKLSASPKNVTLKVTPKAIHTIESYCNWLWNQFSKGNSETINYKNFSKSDEISTLEIKNKEYLFDICQETFEKEFSEIVIKPCKLWEYNKENKFKSFNKKDVCLRVEKKVKDILGLENSVQKDNLLVNWAHKRQDYVNELLIKELYKEEIDWVNIEENEIDVKNELTDSILDSLIFEACQEYKILYS